MRLVGGRGEPGKLPELMDQVRLVEIAAVERQPSPVGLTSLMGAGGTGTMSNLDPTKQRVVAGDPASSYLFFIVHGLDDNKGTFTDPPSNVGYMPMSNSTLCCQKIDALERSIMAGAMNN